MNMRERILGLLGIETQPVSHTEKLISVVGAFVGIAAVIGANSLFLSGSDAVMVVASIGASAVLVFAVPHGALSQPWPVLGGQLVSAMVGVACTQLTQDIILAAPLAVALSVGAMRYLRCVHPPGGATALTAVMGGPNIAALGYWFVVTPVLINVLALLTSAVVFNWLFSWRAYPVYLEQLKKQKSGIPENTEAEPIEREDLIRALGEIDSFIDVNVDDLLRIYDLAVKSRDSKHRHIPALKPGSFYSNGKYGEAWSVRKIVSQIPQNDAQGGSISYQIVAGTGRRSTGVTSMEEFLQWAKHEVYRDEENWRKV